MVREPARGWVVLTTPSPARSRVPRLEPPPRGQSHPTRLAGWPGPARRCRAATAPAGKVQHGIGGAAPTGMTRPALSETPCDLVATDKKGCLLDDGEGGRAGLGSSAKIQIHQISCR
jgi:hypothetical protein